MIRRFICQGLQQKAQGQALVLVTIILTFLMMLIMTCMEVAARYEQRAQIEDALKQATRSSVQAFDYAAFSRNGQLLRAARVCSPTAILRSPLPRRRCARRSRRK